MVIKCLRSLFAILLGVPVKLSSNGGSESKASSTSEFLEKVEFKALVVLAYFLQSNGRAEVAVKATKRILQSNICQNSEKLLRALLHSRDTPDPDCNLSPAQMIFERPQRDSLSFINR